MIEQHQITVTRYRDKAGEPTCAINFQTGQACRFYCTRTFGTRELCMVAVGSIHGDELQRRPDFGTLIPHQECPIWNAAPPATAP